MAHAVVAPDADDMVEALLAALSPDDLFTTDAQKIHRAFFQLKKRYPKEMREFAFDTDRPFPYCEDVAFAFTCLSVAGMVSTRNPYLNKFSVGEKMKDHFNRFAKERIPVSEKILKEMADSLASLLKIE